MPDITDDYVHSPDESKWPPPIPVYGRITGVTVAMEDGSTQHWDGTGSWRLTKTQRQIPGKDEYVDLSYITTELALPDNPEVPDAQV